MKSNSTQNALSAFKKLGAVALITATMFFTACNQAVGGNSGTGGGGGKPTHDITFSVDSTTPNGKLKAKADGEATETEASPITVEHGKAVTFTATADDGYRVKGWTLDGNAVNGTAETYTLTVTQPATVKVSFEAIPKHAITFSVDGANGTLKAVVSDKEINSGDEVEQGKAVTFTATADDGYRVKGWTLDGSTVNGTAETYTLTVTQPATVKVSFELIPQAILTLAPDNFTIKVTAKTVDGSDITVEGCTETTFKSDVETTLTATGTRVVLKGKITELYCNGNHSNNQSLTSLNVQGLTALQKLNCSYNQLTALNVQGLTNLQELKCFRNRLPELNVQGLTALQKLNCSDNKLTALKVQGLTSLQVLSCFSNGLTSLDVQGLTALQTLYCHNNQLTVLNVQGCTALQEVECNSNKLTSLNVQGLTSLQKLDCQYNQLTALDVSGCTALKELNCKGNQLTSLNASGCTSLQKLKCESSQLTELNVQGLTALKELWCDKNQLTSLNVQDCTSLRRLYCTENKLNAQAMAALLNALPSRTAGDQALAFLYTEKTGVTEGNCKDYTQPEDLKKAFEGAKSRNWKLKKYNANENWKDI